jgi:hypothetical protein
MKGYTPLTNPHWHPYRTDEEGSCWEGAADFGCALAKATVFSERYGGLWRVRECADGACEKYLDYSLFGRQNE